MRKRIIGALLLISTISSSLQAKDIVDTAVEAGAFKTLVAAVQAAGLVDALKADGQITVFAPLMTRSKSFLLEPSKLCSNQKTKGSLLLS